MKTVNTSEALAALFGRKTTTPGQLTVEVATTDEAYKFPEGFATRTSNDGKKTFYVIPVEYTLLTSDDSNRTIADVVADLKAKGISDPIAEMNAGIKLAFGDAAKETYRIRKGRTSINSLQQALEVMMADPAKMAEYAAAADKQAYLRSLLTTL